MIAPQIAAQCFCCATSLNCIRFNTFIVPEQFARNKLEETFNKRSEKIEPAQPAQQQQI